MKKFIILMTIFISTMMTASPVGMASGGKGLWSVTIINPTGFEAHLTIRDIFGNQLTSGEIAYSNTTTTLSMPGVSCPYSLDIDMRGAGLYIYAAPSPYYFLSCGITYCGNATVEIVDMKFGRFEIIKK